MKPSQRSSVLLSLAVFFCVNILPECSCEVIVGSTLKGLIKSDEFKSGIPTVLENFGGIATIIKMDFNKPPAEVAMEVADAIVPLIATGLALIPGVGPVIGGLVSGIYGLFKGLFGAPAGPSPMEKMITSIQDDIINIKRTLKSLPERIIEQTRKDLNNKVKAIIHKSINAEVKRNEYVCSKYALTTKSFSDELRNNKTLSESTRIEMIALIQDCDNFMRDTVGALNDTEYADVLWIPSIITTLTRVSFLTEVINYCGPLKVDISMVELFWNEAKSDIKQHFRLYASAVKQRLETFWSPESYSDLDILPILTPIELEGCKMQKQLLFLDREIYPHGVPTEVLISGDDTEINFSDYNISETSGPRHIQVLYNEYRIINSGSMSFLNCIIGSPLITRMKDEYLSFRVNYITQRTYHIRVLYYRLQTRYKTDYTNKNNRTIVEQYHNEEQSLIVNEEGTTVTVSIVPKNISETGVKQFLIPTGNFNLVCRSADAADESLFETTSHVQSAHDEECFIMKSAYAGTFVIESVAALKVSSDAETKKKIVVECKEKLDGYPDRISCVDIKIYGVEFIILD